MIDKLIIEKVISLMEAENKLIPESYSKRVISKLKNFNNDDQQRYLCKTYPEVEKVMKLYNLSFTNSLDMSNSIQFDVNEQNIDQNTDQNIDHNIDPNIDQSIDSGFNIQSTFELEREKQRYLLLQQQHMKKNQVNHSINTNQEENDLITIESSTDNNENYLKEREAIYKMLEEEKKLREQEELENIRKSEALIEKLKRAQQENNTSNPFQEMNENAFINAYNNHKNPMNNLLGSGIPSFEEAKKLNLLVNDENNNKDITIEDYNRFIEKQFGISSGKMMSPLLDKNSQFNGMSEKEYLQLLQLQYSSPISMGGREANFMVGSRILFGGIGTSNTHYQLKINNKFMPKVPLFHPYNPFGTDPSRLRKNAGSPYFPISGLLPDECKKNIPENIKKLIGDNVDFDLYFSTQDQPWQNETILFRPHYLLHDKNMVTQNNVGVVDNNGNILLDFNKYGFSTHDFKLKYPNNSNLIHSICSPPRKSAIKEWNFNETKCLYSIVKDRPCGKPAVTIHWLLNDDDLKTLEKEVVSQLSSGMGTQINFEEIYKSLSALQNKAIPGMTLPLESITGLVSKPDVKNSLNRI